MVTSRGHLNPGDTAVRFHRLDPGLEPLVRHVWIARWRVPPGETRPQRVLTYPAGNIIITPAGAGLHGPDPRVQVQELVGESWVVGVLLRPAGLRALTDTPAEHLVGSSEPLPSAPRDAVIAAMDAPDALDRVETALRTWLRPYAEAVDEGGLVANEAARLAEEDPGLLRVVDLADRLGVHERLLRRTLHDHLGLSPKWLIECRRLQTAATTLFTEPATDLATLSARLGYADQAHFTRRYREVLGETPDQTRRAGRGALT